MAHALTLTHGSTTINLSSGTVAILNGYTPTGAAQRNGEYQPVSETIELTVTGATVAATLATVRDIERLLQLARERQTTRRGYRVWLNYTPNGETGYRCEVLEGQFSPIKSAAQGYNQRLMPYRLHITRMPWWEGPRTQIPLTNYNGTNNTSGLVIYNHDDGDAWHDNYLQIASTDVIGALPAPVELRLTNSDGATRYYRNFYAANNRWGTGLAHIIEGETAIGGYGTAASSAAASGGQYATLTGSGWLTFRWYVPAAALEIIRGRFVRVLARFFTFPSAVREMHLRVYDWSGLVARTPDQTVWSNANGTGYWQDCGAVQLPPTEMSDDTEAWKDVVLELKIKTSGSETMAVDFVMLMPAEEGCFRHIVQEGYGIAANGIVVDGGSPTQTYAYDGVNRFEIYTAQSAPLMVWPGEAQRIYVAWDGTGGAIGWTLSAKAYYRPRKLTF